MRSEPGMKVGQLGIGESRMILAHGAGCNGEARVTVRGPCLADISFEISLASAIIPPVLQRS